MARPLGHVIADSLQLSVGYGERLLAGIPAARFGRLALFGIEVVESNHPAFVYGHLGLYAPRILQQLGHPAPLVPDHFQSLFSKDATCRDDEDGDLYPPMKEITDFFFEGHRMLAGALRGAADAAFDRPNPAEGRMRDLFPTLGSLHTFYCGGHMMMHLGQVSAWRRMERLGSA